MIIDTALQYREMGFPVIPIWSPAIFRESRPYKFDENLKSELEKNAESENPKSEEEIKNQLLIKQCKMPLISNWKQYQKEPPTHDEIVDWFTNWPEANIAIITGEVSGIIVIDLDGDEAFDFINESGGWPETPTVITGRGKHLFYKYPDFEIRNRANKDLQIDTRGNGGYVIVPGSEHGSGRKYEWEDGRSIFNVELAECGPRIVDFLKKESKKGKTRTTESHKVNVPEKVFHPITEDEIKSFKLKDVIQSLILYGGIGSYGSRSEADQAVITSLLRKKLDDDSIFSIFENYPVGEKYRNHNDPAGYLSLSISNAKDFIRNSEIERRSRLRLSDCIYKDDNENFRLELIKFQEYIVHKYKVVIHNDEFYVYNDRYYEHKFEKQINHICQSTLGYYRYLFTIKILKDFLHFTIGDSETYKRNADSDSLDFFNLKNGLYDLKDNRLIPHTPDIFTKNPLPFDYNPSKDCPIFKKTLTECLEGDTEQLMLLQEAVGYGLYPRVSNASMFFLVGDGANGKSLFLDTLEALFGNENTCTVTLKDLSNEYYRVELLEKLINVATETPTKKAIETAYVKAITGGDLITARSPSKTPVKFRPHAKHFFAMNEVPVIDDPTHGMWRRVKIIHFTRTFSEEEMDVTLGEKLKTELSGIFNWALEGLKRLKKNNFQFTKVKKMELFKEKIKIESNGVLSFADENLTDDCYVQLKQAYEEYKLFCNSNGYNQESKNKFKKNLISNGYRVDNSTKSGNQVYIFGPKSADIN